MQRWGCEAGRLRLSLGTQRSDQLVGQGAGRHLVHGMTSIDPWPQRTISRCAETPSCGPPTPSPASTRRNRISHHLHLSLGLHSTRQISRKTHTSLASSTMASRKDMRRADLSMCLLSSTRRCRRLLFSPTTCHVLT
jgi:hypothetical protein